MKLYILVPPNVDKLYFDIMCKWFKLNDWSESFKNKEIEIEHIDSNKIDPDFEKDCILVTDIQHKNTKDYYDTVISLFKKENRFVMIYECIRHNTHKWKFRYAVNNFELIFQNSMFMTKIKNIFWIPCYNLYLKHNEYNEKKENFCCVNPIFDTALNSGDKKRIKRIEIIKDFCNKNENIHVYGSENLKKITTNFKGKVPGENEAGFAKHNWVEKIENKCKLLSKYKFNLVLENLFVDGYVSEKLVESMYSNSVIIYYGPRNIEKMYKDLFEKGIINGHNYKTEEILEIMETMKDEEYKERVDKIKKHREKMNWENSSECVKARVAQKIIEHIYTPPARKPSPL